LALHQDITTNETGGENLNRDEWSKWYGRWRCFGCGWWGNRQCKVDHIDRTGWRWLHSS